MDEAVIRVIIPPDAGSTSAATVGGGGGFRSTPSAAAGGGGLPPWWKLPPWWGTVTWMVNPPPWMTTMPVWWGVPPSQGGGAPQQMPSWLAAPPSWWTGTPIWWVRQPIWWARTPSWWGTAPRWTVAPPRWFSTMPVWMTRLPPWWTTVAAGGKTAPLSLSPLLQLLSTPGSAYFQNMVLALRTGGGGGAAGTSTGSTIRGVFNTTVASAISALTSFTAQLIAPSNSPASALAAVGNAAQGVGGALALLNPVVGATTMAFGAAITGIGQIMESVSGMADKYAQYNPAIAMAQAQAEVRQIMGDIRRSREAAPELARFIREQSDMQQKFEDAKIKIMKAIMPMLLKMMEFLGNIAEGLGKLAGKLKASDDSFLHRISEIMNGVSSIEKNTRKDDEADALYDVFRAIRQGFVEPGSPEEAMLEDKGIPFVKVPKA